MVRRIEVRGVDSSLSGLAVTVVEWRVTADLPDELSSSGSSGLVIDVVRRIVVRGVDSSLSGVVVAVVVRLLTEKLPDLPCCSDSSLRIVER